MASSHHTGSATQMNGSSSTANSNHTPSATQTDEVSALPPAPFIYQDVETAINEECARLRQDVLIRVGEAGEGITHMFVQTHWSEEDVEAWENSGGGSITGDEERLPPDTRGLVIRMISCLNRLPPSLEELPVSATLAHERVMTARLKDLYCSPDHAVIFILVVFGDATLHGQLPCLVIPSEFVHLAVVGRAIRLRPSSPSPNQWSMDWCDLQDYLRTDVNEFICERKDIAWTLASIHQYSARESQSSNTALQTADTVLDGSASESWEL